MSRVARQKKSSFVFVDEVMSTLMVSKAKAYSYIKEWNKELEGMNYVTINGRVPRKFFESKIYGMSDETSPVMR